MQLIESLEKELEKEAVTTRKMLKRIPEDKMTWSPHPKSMNIKTLANHIIELPGWISMTLHTDELDFANNPYKPTHFLTVKELMDHFEDVLEAAKKDLAAAVPAQLQDLWTLREGDVVYSSETKWEVMRMSINQIIHHRAQLGVFLRILDIPIPGSYGPSADEADFEGN